MHSITIALIFVVVLALAFDYINGFHDTANAIATSVSTRALTPKAAILMAASLNFIGALYSTGVAKTIAKDIVNVSAVTSQVMIAALIGAIAWNLATWWFGLPSSSSHALIGGVAGAALVAAGPSAVQGDGILEKVVIPGLVAPVIAVVCGGLAILVGGLHARPGGHGGRTSSVRPVEGAS